MVINFLIPPTNRDDGSDFNAATLKYQMEWIQDRKNGCWTRAYLDELKSIEIVDDYTLKRHFKEPRAVFSATVLSASTGFPISAVALEKDTLLKNISLY